VVQARRTLERPDHRPKQARRRLRKPFRIRALAIGNLRRQVAAIALASMSSVSE
jgi:hypothetical protein